MGRWWKVNPPPDELLELRDSPSKMAVSALSSKHRLFWSQACGLTAVPRGTVFNWWNAWGVESGPSVHTDVVSCIWLWLCLLSVDVPSYLFWRVCLELTTLLLCCYDCEDNVVATLGGGVGGCRILIVRFWMRIWLAEVVQWLTAWNVSCLLECLSQMIVF